MNYSLFSKCGVMYVDHLAVTTADFEQTLDDYLYLDGSRLLKGPSVNPAQKVRYAFVQLRDGFTVEILAPEADSPIARHVQQKGGPYHFCYAIADLSFSIAAAQQDGAKLIVEPTADVAFDGRRIAFLFHEAHGVFELVEAYPVSTKTGLQSDNSGRIGNQPSSLEAVGMVNPNNEEVEKRLGHIFNRVLPKIETRDLPLAAMNDAPEWDSLAQIQLIMEIETAFSCNIPPAEIEKLTSYQAILLYLRQETL